MNNQNQTHNQKENKPLFSNRRVNRIINEAIYDAKALGVVIGVCFLAGWIGRK